MIRPSPLVKYKDLKALSVSQLSTVKSLDEALVDINRESSSINELSRTRAQKSHNMHTSVLSPSFILSDFIMVK